MRALLRDVRNVHQVFLEAVTVEDSAARAFQIDAAWLPGLPFVRWQPLPRVPQCAFGTAATFDEARVDFECAWRV